MLALTPIHHHSPTRIQRHDHQEEHSEVKHSSLFVCYYLMFDLTFTFSFLLNLKTYFYHSPKLYRPQPLANERTLSNDPSAITRN